MKEYVKGASFVDGMIYLKVVGDKIMAYGDMQSLNAAEYKYKTGRLFDYSVTPEEWESAGATARIADGSVVLGLPQEFIREQQEEAIRTERYLRLRACDKISPMRWNAMSETQRADWTAYRQALLDVPQRPGFPWGGDIAKAPWPAKPE